MIYYISILVYIPVRKQVSVKNKVKDPKIISVDSNLGSRVSRKKQKTHRTTHNYEFYFMFYYFFFILILELSFFLLFFMFF